jgi:hypothetical protein
MLKIITVCGLGVGSSLILKMTVDKCEPLLLTPGEAPRRTAAEFGEPNQREQFIGALLALLAGNAGGSECVAYIC